MEKHKIERNSEKLYYRGRYLLSKFYFQVRYNEKIR